MRLLKKGLTESIYNSILNEGSFGDEVGFGDFSSIDEMEEEFTNKLYSFFGKEPSDLNFSKFELHRGTSWTDDNPWMLVEATGLDDIFEDIIVEKGKSEYPNLYNLYQEDGIVIYETGLEVGRNHGDRNYFDVVVYNTTDIHYLTYEEMSSDQGKELEKKVDEESNRICAYMEGIIKEHYQELLDIMLNNEYIDEDDEMYESKKAKRGKKLTEAERELEFDDNGNQKIFYFIVGICLDENRPDAHEEDFYDMPDFGIPYKLIDENFGVTYNRLEAIKYVQHYIKDGVAGTFGAVIEASAPEGVNITQTISAGWADWIDGSDIYHFKKAGGKLIYCGYSKGEHGKDIQNLVGRMLIESADVKGPTLDKDSNFYCEWCGSKFKAEKKADGSMPNCPTCYKKRYKDDPKRDEDGHANKDVHLIESAKVKEKFGKNITYEDLEDMVYDGGDDSDAAVIFDDIGYKSKSNDLLDLINKKKLTNKEDILDFIVNSKEVDKLREGVYSPVLESKKSGSKLKYYETGYLSKEDRDKCGDLQIFGLRDGEGSSYTIERGVLVNNIGYLVANFDVLNGKDELSDSSWGKYMRKVGAVRVHSIDEVKEEDSADAQSYTVEFENKESGTGKQYGYVVADSEEQAIERAAKQTGLSKDKVLSVKLSESLNEATDEEMEKLKKELRSRADDLHSDGDISNFSDDDINKVAQAIKEKGFFISNNIFADDSDEYEWEQINMFLDNELRDYDFEEYGRNSEYRDLDESSDEAKRAPIRKYTAYVFNWVNDHGYSEEFKKVWDKYSAPEYDGMSTEEIMGLVFNELADENGFNGELFVSPAEFYDNEGLEESVKKNLKENAVNELVSWMYDNFPDNSFYKEGKLENGKTVYYFDKHGDMEVVKKAIKDKFGDEVSFGTATSEYAPESREFVVIMDSDKVNLTKMDWDEGLEGYTYYTDEDNYIYAKNNESGRLYLCTDDGDPEQEIQDDMNYILTESEESGWKEVDSKSVPDSDGFTTDYTMYEKDGKYIFIFGDKDAYTPENSDPDWEAESEAEAKEWFDNYNGFDGMSENVDEIESIGSIEEIDGKMYYVSDSTDNGFCYKDAKAYNNEPDKICYLSEGAFDESEDGKIAVDYVEANKERLVDWGSADTKNSIREQVRTMFEEEEYWYESDSGEKIEAKDFDDELVDQIADDAFSMVDWQSVNGFLLEREWDEAVEEYYDKKFGTLKEAAKPKKKKAKKDEKDEKRVVMQQGNVTCFKENDSKYLVFENESDNEKEYSDQDSAMEDFMSRVGIDTDRKLKESVIVAGNKIPIRKRPTKK